jgi:hypothetical protein
MEFFHFAGEGAGVGGREFVCSSRCKSALTFNPFHVQTEIGLFSDDTIANCQP